MVNRSKKYRDARANIEADREYGISEAVALLKSAPKAGFDETVELCVLLGIDPKNSDQQIRSSVGLPHGTGKTVRVVVFAEGEAAEEAAAAGADQVGSDDLIEKISGGWLEFDVALATPAMMRKMGALGRFLGPRGLMPNPKNGTLRNDVAEGVKEFKAGKVEIRNDDGANVHIPVGKLSFEKNQLEENIKAVLKSLLALKPPGGSHNFFRKAVLTSTMKPSVRLIV